MKNKCLLGVALVAATLGTVQSSMAKEQQKNPPEAIQDLYSIIVALAQYTVDSNGVLPPMENTEVVKKAIWPYSHNEASFINSKTGNKYQPNLAVSGMKLSAIAGKKVVLFYEPKASADGKRWVLFLPRMEKNGDFDLRNNHEQYVQQVTEKQWQKLHLKP